MTDIPEELVEEIIGILYDFKDGHLVSDEAARSAIRAVLDWQASNAGGE